MKKYKTKFDGFYFLNKWKEKHWGDYCLIGVSKYIFSPVEYEWIISFFGFCFRFWFKKVY